MAERPARADAPLGLPAASGIAEDECPTPWREAERFCSGALLMPPLAVGPGTRPPGGRSLVSSPSASDSCLRFDRVVLFSLTCSSSFVFTHPAHLSFVA